MGNTLQARATVARIETESTVRQAAAEPSVVDDAIVGTCHLPGNVACVNLGALGAVKTGRTEGETV
jgi:hypothetical protein